MIWRFSLEKLRNSLLADFDDDPDFRMLKRILIVEKWISEEPPHQFMLFVDIEL